MLKQKKPFFLRKFHSQKCHWTMCTFQLCWNDQRKLSEPSSLLLGGNTPCMNCEFIWRNAVCWEKSRAPFLSHHWNKPHRSSFLTQRSWLAPSRICFTILAFSQHWAPALSVLTGKQLQPARAHRAGTEGLPQAGLTPSPRWPWALPPACPDGPAQTRTALCQGHQGLFSQTKKRANVNI